MSAETGERDEGGRMELIIQHQAAEIRAQQEELRKCVDVYKNRTSVDPLAAAAAARVKKKRRPGQPSGSSNSSKKRRIDSKGSGKSPIPPMTSIKQVKHFLAMAGKKTRAVDRETFCVALKDSALEAKVGFVSNSGLSLLKAWIKSAIENSEVRLLGVILRVLTHLPTTFMALKESKIARVVLYFSSSAPVEKGHAPHADSAILKMADRLIHAWKQLSAEYQTNKAAIASGAARVDAATGKVVKGKKKASAKSETKSAAQLRLAKIAARAQETLRLEKKRRQEKEFLKAARPTIALPKVSTALDGVSVTSGTASIRTTPSAGDSSKGSGGSPNSNKRRVSWAPELEEVCTISPRATTSKNRKGNFRDALQQEKAMTREILGREQNRSVPMEATMAWTEPAKLSLTMEEKTSGGDESTSVSKEAHRLRRINKMSVEVVYLRDTQIPRDPTKAPIPNTTESYHRRPQKIALVDVSDAQSLSTAMQPVYTPPVAYGNAASSSMMQPPTTSSSTRGQSHHQYTSQHTQPEYVSQPSMQYSQQSTQRTSQSSQYAQQYWSQPSSQYASQQYATSHSQQQQQQYIPQPLSQPPQYSQQQDYYYSSQPQPDASGQRHTIPPARSPPMVGMSAQHYALPPPSQQQQYAPSQQQPQRHYGSSHPQRRY